MKKLMVALFAFQLLMPTASHAQSKLDILFQMIEEAGCTVEEGDLQDALAEAGASEEESAALIEQLVEAGSLQFDENSGSYTLVGFGECN